MFYFCYPCLFYSHLFLSVISWINQLNWALQNIYDDNSKNVSYKKICPFLIHLSVLDLICDFQNSLIIDYLCPWGAFYVCLSMGIPISPQRYQLWWICSLFRKVLSYLFSSLKLVFRVSVTINKFSFKIIACDRPFSNMAPDWLAAQLPANQKSC